MSISNQYHPNVVCRTICRFAGRTIHQRNIKRYKDTRILVILHLFYMEAWPEIREYLKNLSPYSYSIIVTCVKGFCDEETMSSVKSFKKDVRIIECNNVGWDILPFIKALHSVDLADYDIIFKLHSKGIRRHDKFIYGQYFRRKRWFLNLFEGCIGPFTVHTSIRSLMEKDNCTGLVAARNLIVKDTVHKRHFVEETCRELNLQYLPDYFFVAGTCFAVRANLMTTFQQLNIEEDKFASTGFSLAHRIERILCFSPIWAGLKLSGPNVLLLRRSLWVFHPFAWRWHKYNGARMLEDPRVHINDLYAYKKIERSLIANWKFVEVKASDIKWKMYPRSKVVIPLEQTLLYKYLVTKDAAIYEEHRKYNMDVWKNDLMSRESFDRLILKLDNEGYKPDCDIVLQDDNIICDGLDICCWLLYKYGTECTINALLIHKYRPLTISRVKKSIYPVKSFVWRILHFYDKDYN